MIILNAGIPRSGTVLVNAMLRQICDMNECRYQSLNKHGAELERLVGKAAQINASDTIHVFHMHDWAPALHKTIEQTPRKVICFANRRDPRDVCVSLMKLHDIPLERSIQLTLGSVHKYLTMLRDISVNVIQYEEHIQNPLELVLHLAKVMNLPLTSQQAEKTVAATSVKKHSKIMEDVASESIQGIRKFKNSTRTFREHASSHITDRHIQSGLVNRWRSELNTEDQDRVNDALSAAITRLGYSLLRNE